MRPRHVISDIAVDALKLAVKTAKGPSRLAAHLGVSSQAIAQWGQVPAGRVLDVEAATGIPRHALRPDLYPAPPTPSEPEARQ